MDVWCCLTRVIIPVTMVIAKRLNRTKRIIVLVSDFCKHRPRRLYIYIYILYTCAFTEFLLLLFQALQLGDAADMKYPSGKH